MDLIEHLIVWGEVNGGPNTVHLIVRGRVWGGDGANTVHLIVRAVYGVVMGPTLCTSLSEAVYWANIAHLIVRSRVLGRGGGDWANIGLPLGCDLERLAGLLLDGLRVVQQRQFIELLDIWNQKNEET